MKYVGSLLTGLVFLHALVATPLLVECFQTDGRYLLEILGNDPCHELGFERPAANAPGTRATLESIRGTDPCLDLLMDNPGCTRICSDVPASPLQAPVRMAPDPCAEAGYALVAEPRVTDPGRSDLLDPVSPSRLPLRI